jgi:hypothetical protein
MCDTCMGLLRTDGSIVSVRCLSNGLKVKLTGSAVTQLRSCDVQERTSGLDHDPLRYYCEFSWLYGRVAHSFSAHPPLINFKLLAPRPLRGMCGDFAARQLTAALIQDNDLCSPIS